MLDSPSGETESGTFWQKITSFVYMTRAHAAAESGRSIGARSSVGKKE